MIKLIASDIDGTLVKDGTLAIDREYMEVIGRLIDKGIVFVACSGRQYRSERKLFTLSQTDCFISLTEELLYGLRRKF